MFTVASVLFGICISVMAYKTGYDHAELKYDTTPTNVDEVLEKYDRVMKNGN